MKTGISARVKKILPFAELCGNTPRFPISVVDVREEYANAFRTESYNEFWTRIQAVSSNAKGDSSVNVTGARVESTSAARLPSYRLFAEHLLDPDQATVIKILDLGLVRNPLLSKYFSETADAFFLCGLLLKDIDQISMAYRSLKTTLQALQSHTATPFSPQNHFPNILTTLTQFTNSLNPFNWSSQVRLMQADCLKLLRQLESSRDKAKAKLHLKTRLKNCSAIFLVALAASLTAIVATHALALLVASPTLITASLELGSTSTRRLAKRTTQLDAAAKGSYILSRDMDTISRLVDRLNDELDHTQTTVKYWVERGDQGRFQGNGTLEVVRQLNKNDCGFRHHLDELEEHLYLCFMTINRARNLVLKEILDPGQ